MKKALSALFVIVLTSPAFAGVLTPKGVITETYTSGGWTMLHIDNQSTNTFGCSLSGWYAINTTDNNYTGLLSNILAAQMAGKQVTFYVSGCGGQAGQYPKIESIIVYS